MPGFAREFGLGRGENRRIEKQTGLSKELLARGVGLESEVSNTDKAAWEHVLEETPHEVWRTESEESAAVAATTITIAEGYTTVTESHQSFVSDGDALSVAAEVPEHLVRTGHGSFAVDDPVPGGGLLQEALPERRADASGASVERVMEALEELAPKDPGQDAYGYEEVRTGSDPAIARGAEAAARDDAVDVRMKGQGLRPGVKHRNRAREHPETALAHGVEGPHGSLEE